MQPARGGAASRCGFSRGYASVRNGYPSIVPDPTSAVAELADEWAFAFRRPWRTAARDTLEYPRHQIMPRRTLLLGDLAAWRQIRIPDRCCQAANRGRRACASPAGRRFGPIPPAPVKATSVGEDRIMPARTVRHCARSADGRFFGASSQTEQVGRQASAGPTTTVMAAPVCRFGRGAGPGLMARSSRPSEHHRGRAGGESVAGSSGLTCEHRQLRARRGFSTWTIYG